MVQPLCLRWARQNPDDTLIRSSGSSAPSSEWVVKLFFSFELMRTRNEDMPCGFKPGDAGQILAGVFTLSFPPLFVPLFLSSTHLLSTIAYRFLRSKLTREPVIMASRCGRAMQYRHRREFLPSLSPLPPLPSSSTHLFRITSNVHHL